MNHPTYLFDFKNVTSLIGVEKVLSDWSVNKLSDRSFEATGRDFTRSDIIQLYQWIGPDGHIFVYDFQTKGEYYRQKNPAGRKRSVARDSDLDTLTLQAIESFLAHQEEST